MDRPAAGVGVLVWKNGKLLLGKRVSKHGMGTWSVPGGYLEYGESFEEGARRENLEETGVEIKNVRFLWTTNNIFHSEKKHTITVFMESDWASGEPTTTEHDKFVEVGWFTPSELPSPLFLALFELQKAKPDLFTT